MEKSQITISTVNHLVEVLNERILGYEKAAENVKDAEVEPIFRGYSEQARKFADELIPFSDKYSATDLGTRPQADAWRTWMDIKSAITQGGRNAMIGASIRGEDAAITNYEEALETDNLNPEVKGIISKQLSEIRSAKSRIEKLKS